MQIEVSCYVVYQPNNIDAVITAAILKKIPNVVVYSIEETIPTNAEKYIWLGIDPTNKDNALLEKTAKAENYFLRVSNGFTKNTSEPANATEGMFSRGSNLYMDVENAFVHHFHKVNAEFEMEIDIANFNSILAQAGHLLSTNAGVFTAETSSMAVDLAMFYLPQSQGKDRPKVWFWYTMALLALNQGQYLEILDEEGYTHVQERETRYNAAIAVAKAHLAKRTSVQQVKVKNRFLDIYWVTAPAADFPLVELLLRLSGRSFANVTVGVNGLNVYTNVPGLELADSFILNHVVY